jgi:hypothetical protein
MVVAYGVTRLQAWVRLADRLGVSRWWVIHFAAESILDRLPAWLAWAYGDAMRPAFVDALERAKAQGLGKGRGVKSNRRNP